MSSITSPGLHLDREPYDPGDVYDETFAAAGIPRPHCRELVDALAGCELSDLAAAVSRRRAALAIEFGSGPDRAPFPVDPVPRILDAVDSDLLLRGLAQRADALNAFLADIREDRRMVADGRIPARVLDGVDVVERDVRSGPRRIVPAGVIGFDVVRAPDGELRVLEDNLRTPSGLAYTVAIREIVDELPLVAPAERLEPGIVSLLARALRAAAPDGNPDPAVVVLTDGPSSSAWWEHRRLARALGVPLVTPADLEVRRGRIWRRADPARPIEVIYRRSDDDRLREPEGGISELGELLMEPLSAWGVACLNVFGTGLADDKLVHAYVEEMVRYYLREEPLIRSVHTYDLAEPAVRECVLARIDELVVKPRSGSGGDGVVVCPHATPEDRRRAARLVATRPEQFVAQELVPLSTHPTIVDGRLEPRHVDLRAFAFSTPDGASVAAGGLTRVALDEGALVVNSSQHGGAKDTWMLR